MSGAPARSFGLSPRFARPSLRSAATPHRTVRAVFPHTALRVGLVSSVSLPFAPRLRFTLIPMDAPPYGRAGSDAPPHSGGIKELIDTVVIDTVTPWWTAHMAKESHSRYAPRPWGMQPNTSPAALSPRFPWADFHSCLYTAYYTISGVLTVIGCGREY